MVEASRHLVLPPAATLAAMVELVRSMLGQDSDNLRLGRRRLSRHLVTVARDPRAFPDLPALDAEGEPRRYQPLVYRGALVGTLSDRGRARDLGLSRSSGSLLRRGSELAIDVDCLTIDSDPAGPGIDDLLGRAGVEIRDTIPVPPTTLIRRIVEISCESREVQLDALERPIVGLAPAVRIDLRLGH